MQIQSNRQIPFDAQLKLRSTIFFFDYVFNDCKTFLHGFSEIILLITIFRI